MKLIRTIRRLLRVKEEERKSKSRSRKHEYKKGIRKDLGLYNFRSSWEANVARFFNLKGIHWEYEPEFFRINDPVYPHIKYYLPDFKVKISKDCTYYVEVKGYMDRDSWVKIKNFRKDYCGTSSRVKLNVIGSSSYKKIEKLYSKKIPNWEH